MLTSLVDGKHYKRILQVLRAKPRGVFQPIYILSFVISFTRS